MPRMNAAIYAAHMDNTLKLAAAAGGVSRNQLVDKLNVTRAVATKLINESGLAVTRKIGRTEFFAEPVEDLVVAKQSKPDAVKASTVPTSTNAADETDESLAELDAQIVDTRNALREAAGKAGKALGEWATHSALVDALRERMTDLATKRMNIT
jgi:hypothetical protein